MTHNIHRDYHILLAALVREAECKAPSPNRTGTPSWRLIGETLRHDFSQGFPLIWSKRVFWRGVVEELLWFLRGSTDERELASKNVNIWREWAGEDGQLGPIYGKQWRDAGGVDQVAFVLNEMRTNPTSRRAVVSCWRPDELPKMKLAPCHYSWQLLQHEGKLHMVMNMRSGDVFLGVPFNIASYALLLLMYCKALNMTPGTLTLNTADAHLYENHFDAARAQLAYWEEPERIPDTPQVKLLDHADWWNRVLGSAEEAFWVEQGDIVLLGYKPGPSIKAEVAV